MRKFINKVVIFSIPFVILGIILEITLREIPNDYKYKRDYLTLHSEEIETLILGSSHTYYGVNPIYFKSPTYNASHVSQTLYYDSQILNKYRLGLTHLHTVVLPISYFTLFTRLDKGSESWRIKNYVIYYGVNSNKFSNYSELLSNDLNNNFRRLFSFFILKNDPLTSNKYGWGMNYRSVNAKNLVESGKVAAQRHTREDIKNEKYESRYRFNLVILDSIINKCNEMGVRVLLITPPAYSSYRHCVKDDQLEVTFNTAIEMENKYDNCTYLNLFSDERFKESDFYDGDHLSEIGAEKLSIILSDIIDNPQLEKK